MRYRLIAALLLGLVTAACSGNPSLPMRRVDHPYTLPKDTTALSFGAGFTQIRDTSSRTTTRGYPVGVWQLPLSDTWTWEFLTAVRHQLHRDDRSTYGFRFGLESIGYSTLSGLYLVPALSFTYKRKHSERFAWENTLGGSSTYRSRRGDKNGWRGFVKSAFLFQLSDEIALVPYAIPTAERQFGLLAFDEYQLLPENKTAWTLPLGLEFSWRLHLQWEAHAEYTFRGIGYSRGYRAQTGTIFLAHYF